MMQPLDFNFQAIMETDVSDVENINPRKTPGQDSSIVPILLKKTASAQCCPIFGAIFNYCIAEGFWSTKWKIGEWTPVFKKGDKRAKEKYRSITVLHYLGKCLNIYCVNKSLCTRIVSSIQRSSNLMTFVCKEGKFLRINIKRITTK